MTVFNPLRSLPVPNHEASSHCGRMHLRSPFALGSHCHLWHVVYRAPRSLGDRCHDILTRLAYTVLFVVASAVFGSGSLWAFRKTGTLHE